MDTDKRGGLRWRCLSNSLFWEIPEYPYDTFLEHRNMGGAEMLNFEEAKTGEGYFQYMEILDEAGYELYAENQIKESHYSTWQVRKRR